LQERLDAAEESRARKAARDAERAEDEIAKLMGVPSAGIPGPHNLHGQDVHGQQAGRPTPNQARAAASPSQTAQDLDAQLGLPPPPAIVPTIRPRVAIDAINADTEQEIKDQVVSDLYQAAMRSAELLATTLVRPRTVQDLKAVMNTLTESLKAIEFLKGNATQRTEVRVVEVSALDAIRSLEEKLRGVQVIDVTPESASNAPWKSEEVSPNPDVGDEPSDDPEASGEVFDVVSGDSVGDDDEVEDV
jgi:hypothetical protein